MMAFACVALAFGPPPLGRRDVLAAGAALFLPSPAHALDVTAAMEAATAGAGCPTQSCVDASIDRLTRLLDDTAGMKKNVGAAAQHRPIVTVKPIFGAPITPGRDTGSLVPRYQITMVVPHPVTPTDYVQLMWLRDAETGRVLAARAIEPATVGGGISAPVVEKAAGAGTLGARSVLGPPTLTADVGKGYVARGDRVIPYSYDTKHGLWEGEPVTLCEGKEACDGAGATRLPLALDVRVRRPLEEIGQDVLRQLGLPLDPSYTY